LDKLSWISFKEISPKMDAKDQEELDIMLIEEKSNCEQITQNLIDEIKGVNMYIDQ